MTPRTSFQAAPIRSVVLRFASIYAPLLAATAGIVTTLYWTQDRAEQAAIAINQRDHIAFQSEIILADFKSIVSDLHILAEARNLRAFLDDPRPARRNEMGEHYQLFIASTGLYDQVRLLDDSGMEVVRVNLVGDRGILVAPNQLQSKRERYYFTDSFRLGRGEVFVSPFDLNVEEGQVEEPLKPAIRFGTPVYDSAGCKRGIVVLNYLGAKLIEKLRRAEVNSLGRTLLVRGDGYWLKGPRPEGEWGFMFPDRRDQTLAHDFPSAWPRIATEEAGQLRSSEGLFTFRTIHPASAAQLARPTGHAATLDGAQVATLGGERIAGPAPYVWKVLSHIEPAHLAARSDRLRAGLLRMMAALSVVLAGVSWLWARTRIQQQDAQRRLLQAERLAAIGEAMAGLAHESRNTLQRSKGGLDLLARRVADRPEALELLTEVEQAQDHLHALYEEVRGYAAPLTLQRQEVDLRDLVHKAWGHLASRQSGRAELTIASSDVDWRCAVDPEAFVQVLRNVLENALDAGTPARIHVEASDARIGGRAAVRLSIRDHGSGMSPQARASLFEPFFTTKVRGTGLGLAICKRIVEAHGGLVAVGEAAGPGTELVIMLPRRGQ